MLKIKNDHKVIMALRQGIIDGILHNQLGIRLNDKYYTQKESQSYNYAAMLCDTDYIRLWQAGNHELTLVEHAIKKQDILPVGWKVSRCIDSNFIPFIEEK